MSGREGLIDAPETRENGAPVHPWPARLYLWVATLFLAFLVVAVLTALLWGAGELEGAQPVALMGMLLILGSGFVVLWGLHRFRRWGWSVNMLLLLFALVNLGLQAFRPELTATARTAAAAAALAVVGWLKHFWDRREEFG